MRDEEEKKMSSYPVSRCVQDGEKRTIIIYFLHLLAVSTLGYITELLCEVTLGGLQEAGLAVT